MAVLTVAIELMQILAKCVGLEDAARTQLKQEAADLANAIQDGAPVLTGYLRDSIHEDEEDGDPVVKIDAEYAGFVEYGTSTRPAHPFVEPAIERSRVNMGKNMQTQMWRVT